MEAAFIYGNMHEITLILLIFNVYKLTAVEVHKKFSRLVMNKLQQRLSRIWIEFSFAMTEKMNTYSFKMQMNPNLHFMLSRGRSENRVLDSNSCFQFLSRISLWSTAANLFSLTLYSTKVFFARKFDNIWSKYTTYNLNLKVLDVKGKFLTFSACFLLAGLNNENTNWLRFRRVLTKRFFKKRIWIQEKFIW